MSLGMTIAMLIVGWLTVALALLWGVLRISRRHHQRQTLHVAPTKAKMAGHGSLHADH